jgi:hypothetical protein
MTMIHDPMPELLRRAAALPLLCALAACHPDAARGGTPGALTGTSGTACASAAPETRWAGGGYVRAAVYGNDPDGWLSSVNGVAALQDGRVAVLDGSAARVVVLDGELKPVREFGRKGGGPGELSPNALMGMQGLQRTFNYLEATDTALFVYNSNGIAVFGWDGRFKQQYGGLASGFIAPFTLRAMQAAPRGVLYGYDTLDMSGGRGHRLQTWAVVDGDRRRLVAEVPVTPPPMRGTTFQVGTRQARALWASRNGCAAMSDGGSQWLARVDAGTGRVDTIPLPRHDVPAYDAALDDRMAGRMAQLGGALGGRARVETGMSPTLLARWSEMTIDPDGHLWIRPWTRREEREGPVAAYQLSMANGRVQRETLPAFPQAFGRPGVFYAVEKDPETDEILLVMYQKRGG